MEEDEKIKNLGQIYKILKKLAKILKEAIEKDHLSPEKLKEFEERRQELSKWINKAEAEMEKNGDGEEEDDYEKIM